MKLKSFIKTRSVGFWITAAFSLTALITAIVYGACYASTEDFSVTACVLTVVSVLFFGLEFTKFGGLAPFVQLTVILMAFGFYVYSVYYYVSVVLVGIDLDSFSPVFIACTVLYIVLILVSAVNVFFKQGAKHIENAGKTEDAKGVKV